MARNQKDFTYDNAMLLKDAGAVTADAPRRSPRRHASSISAPRAWTAASSSTSRRSTSPRRRALRRAHPVLQLGHVRVGRRRRRRHLARRSPHDRRVGRSVIGRYELPFSNEINGTTYRYARAYTNVSGTTPSINYTAYIVQAF
jgi:hypothetical protein